MKTDVRIIIIATLCLVHAVPCLSIGPRPQPGGILSGEPARHYFLQRPDIIDVPQELGAVRTSETCRALVLLVDFRDKPAQLDGVHFTNMLFSEARGSMRHYFEENSYGEFHLAGDVYGWYRSACRHSDIVNRDSEAETADDFGLDTSPGAIDTSTCAFPLNIWGMVAHAVELASADVDLSLYDNDGADGLPSSGDDDGFVDVLIIVHSGIGAEDLGDLPIAINYMWSLKSDLDSYRPTRATSFQGIRIGAFALVPEIGEIGVYAHEFCHLLGLPDLYNSETSVPVVGPLCLMDSGAWNGPQHARGSVPGHLCAPMKHILGWVQPLKVCLGCEGTDVAERAAIGPHGTDPSPYQVLGNPGGMDWTPAGTGRGEYFLVENRQRSEGYYEAYLPASGLVIWKFDESVPDNNSPGKRLAEVIQADGEVIDPEDPWRNIPGEPSDFWPGSMGKHDFTPETDPPSSLSGGRFSGVSIRNINLSGPTSITADIRVGLPKKGVAYAFPNPYRLSDSSPMRIVFLPDPGPDTPHPGSFEVTVFDLEGNLVRRLDAASEILDNGTALWNGEDETGNRVGPGLYFFSARSSGQEATGMLGIKK
jgi:immune inhibitor A